MSVDIEAVAAKVGKLFGLAYDATVSHCETHSCHPCPPGCAEPAQKTQKPDTSVTDPPPVGISYQEISGNQALQCPSVLTPVKGVANVLLSVTGQSNLDSSGLVFQAVGRMPDPNAVRYPVQIEPNPFHGPGMVHIAVSSSATPPSRGLLHGDVIVSTTSTGQTTRAPVVVFMNDAT